MNITDNRYKELEEEYVNNKETSCPLCNNFETISLSMFLDNDLIIERNRCQSCNAKWETYYRITGIKILNDGKEKD